MIKLVIAGSREFTDQIQYKATQYPSIRLVNITTEPSTTVDVLENVAMGADAVLFGFDDEDIQLMVDVITRNKIESVFFISTSNISATFKKWARYRFKPALAGSELETINRYFIDNPAAASPGPEPESERKIFERKARVEAIREREDKNRLVVVDKKIVVVFGQKGGIGKTVTLVSLARSINHLTNMRVAIADLDMNRDYGDVIRYFGILGDLKSDAISITEEDYIRDHPVIPEKTLSAWTSFPWEMKHMREVVDSCLVKIKNNLYVLPPLRSITDESEITYELVQDVLDVLRRHFSIVLVDGGNTLSTPTLAAMEAADDLIILSSAEIPVLDGLADFTASTIDKIKGNPIISLALNRVPPDCPLKLENELPKITRGRPVVAMFPHDEQFFKTISNDVDVPYFGAHNIPYTQEMEKLLYHIIPKDAFKTTPKESKGGFFSSIFRRFGKLSAVK